MGIAVEAAAIGWRLPRVKQTEPIAALAYRDYFASLADIVSVQAKAEREGQLRERIRFLCRPSLLVIDEIGYLPVIQGGGNLFFSSSTRATSAGS